MFQMLVVCIFIVFMLLQKVNGLIVSDAFEGLCNVAFQKLCITFQGFQSLRSTVENTLKKGFYICFLQVK